MICILKVLVSADVFKNSRKMLEICHLDPAKFFQPEN